MELAAPSARTLTVSREVAPLDAEAKLAVVDWPATTLTRVVFTALPPLKVVTS